MLAGEQMKQLVKGKCPCCGEALSISVSNETVGLSVEKQNDIETSQLLEELSIEFG